MAPHRTTRRLRVSVLPTVSVVVPTRGRPARVLALIEALLAEFGLEEVVVVCDGDDETLHQLQDRAEAQPRLRPFGQPPQGAGAAREHGVRVARGDVVLLLDDDVVPDPGLVEGHAREHARHVESVLVVGALLTQRPVRRTVNSITTEVYADDYATCVADWERDPTTLLTHLWAGNLSLPRSTALRVGLCSADMAGLYFEDQQLGLRLRAARVPAVHRPDLRVRHEHERSLSAFLSDAERQGRALPLLHRDHPDVVPAPTVARITGRAPAPARWCVFVVARGGALSRALPRALLGAARLAGVVRAWQLQRLLVLLLRRLGQARGLAETRQGSAHA